jgi:hypothetical protein
VDRIKFLFNPKTNVILDHWEKLKKAINDSVENVLNSEKFSDTEDDSTLGTWDKSVHLRHTSDKNRTCLIFAYLDAHGEDGIHVKISDTTKRIHGEEIERSWRAPINEDTWPELQKWVSDTANSMLKTA